MSFLQVGFLNKEYVVSDNIPILVPILQQFDGYKEHLLELIISQMKADTYSGGADEDFVFWDKPIREIAKKIIVSAAGNEIYDLTENDLVDKNPGYKNLHDICSNTIRQIADMYANSIQDFINESNQAYNDAASNITGSGVSVWTSSLSGALWYSFLEGNTLRKQAKQADKQYSEAMREISRRNTSNQKNKENTIKVEYYYPKCKSSISIIISYMLNAYLDVLDRNQKLNCSELSKYDYQASMEIMKNLDIIPQKAEVLGKAFEKCPYNLNVYIKAIDLKLIDDETINTVKYFNLGYDLKLYVDEIIGGDLSIDQIKAVIPSKQYFIHIKAKLSDKKDMEIKRELASKAYEYVIAKYYYFNQLCSDDEKCLDFSKEVKSTDDIEVYVARTIKNSVSNEKFDLLKNLCGYLEIYDDLIPDGYNDELDKTTIDDYLINKISAKCKPIVEDRIQKEKIQKEKKEQEEKIQKQQQEEEQKRLHKQETIGAVIIGLIVIVAIIFLIVFCYIIPNGRYKKARELMNSHKYLEAMQMFEKADKEKYVHRIEECEKLYISELNNNKQYDEAIEYLTSVKGVEATSDEIRECKYLKAMDMYESNKFDDSIALFNEISSYKDSKDKINACKYGKACELYDSGEYEASLSIFKELSSYSDSEEKVKEIQKEIKYNDALKKLESGNYVEFISLMDQLGNYKDANKYIGDYKEKGCEELFNKKAYSQCIEYCAKYNLRNDYFYDSNYEYGMYLYNNGNVGDAWNYLVCCTDKYPEVESLVIECENEKNYEHAITAAEGGNFDYAIYELEKLSGYKNANLALTKCKEAYRYVGYFNSYSYKVIRSDGSVSEMPAGKGYGDAKALNISASLTKDLKIIYSANGHKSEPNSTMIYYHKYSDRDDSYIDIVNKKIVNEYSDGEKYVTLYK